MSVVCPVNLDVEKLKSEVRSIYSQVAEDPAGEFHFHRGMNYAADVLGYDLDALKSLPRRATARLCGTGNPFKMGSLPEGGTVVDIGSGAGTDCLLAAKQVGHTGQVIGIDMTDAMLETARLAAKEAGLENVRFEKAEMAQLPLPDASVDVVISNGVINLAPDKSAIFLELYRIVKPGGRLQFADITLKTELSESARNDISLWTG